MTNLINFDLIGQSLFIFNRLFLWRKFSEKNILTMRLHFKSVLISSRDSNFFFTTVCTKMTNTTIMVAFIFFKIFNELEILENDAAVSGSWLNLKRSLFDYGSNVETKFALVNDANALAALQSGAIDVLSKFFYLQNATMMENISLSNPISCEMCQICHTIEFQSKPQGTRLSTVFISFLSSYWFIILSFTLFTCSWAHSRSIRISSRLIEALHGSASLLCATTSSSDFNWNSFNIKLLFLSVIISITFVRNACYSKISSDQNFQNIIPKIKHPNDLETWNFDESIIENQDCLDQTLYFNLYVFKQILWKVRNDSSIPRSLMYLEMLGLYQNIPLDHLKQRKPGRAIVLIRSSSKPIWMHKLCQNNLRLTCSSEFSAHTKVLLISKLMSKKNRKYFDRTTYAYLEMGFHFRNYVNSILKTIKIQPKAECLNSEHQIFAYLPIKTISYLRVTIAPLFSILIALYIFTFEILRREN